MTSPSNRRGILCDSDFIIALAIPEESTHKRARELFTSIEHRDFFMLRLIKYEIATVLSREFGHVIAHKIIRDLNCWATGMLSIEEMEGAIWSEYYSHKSKNISFFDCANLVAARHYGFKIASFDGFYPKEWRV